MSRTPAPRCSSLEIRRHHNDWNGSESCDLHVHSDRGCAGSRRARNGSGRVAGRQGGVKELEHVSGQHHECVRMQALIVAG